MTKYTETLKHKNQHELISASKRQTKFMLSTVSTLNQTETRINKQLARFRKKINESIHLLEDMSYWYQKVDANRLSLHVLASYQIASNFIHEIIAYYTKILDVQSNKTNFQELISPTHIENILKNASNKLPSNLEILSIPLLSTKMTLSQEKIHAFGYFTMVERSNFQLLKITPVPLRITNNEYWILDVPNEIIAVDYDEGLYFLLTDEELHRSIILRKEEYLCSPSVIRNIENSPNCIVDEIYQRTDNTTCNIKKHEINSIIWKQLYMENTWMFITREPTRISLTCNGIRQDTKINGTGIIQVSQECVIKTKQNIITPKRFDNIKVLKAYTKHVPVNISKVTPLKKHTVQFDKEPVMSVSDDFTNILQEEEELKKELGETDWKQIRHHSFISNVVVVTIISSLFGLIIITKMLLKYWPFKTSSTSTKSCSPEESTQPLPVNRGTTDPESEMIEMQPFPRLFDN